MSNGLLDLRKAKAFAATFDPTWDERSSDTFLRWLKKLDQLRSPEKRSFWSDSRQGVRHPIG